MRDRTIDKEMVEGLCSYLIKEYFSDVKFFDGEYTVAGGVLTANYIGKLPIEWS